MKLYEKTINETNILEQTPLHDYLKKSLESDNKDLCNGWDFLKTNLTTNLKNILLNPEYDKIVYNSENVKFILDELGINLNEDLKKQLGSFVYVWKDIKTQCVKQEQEEKLKKELLQRGFIEQHLIKDKEEVDLSFLADKKVICVLDISKIGMLGSYDSKEEIKGKFIYDETNNNLMLLPARCRTRGFLVRNKFYYKELGGKK